MATRTPAHNRVLTSEGARPGASLQARLEFGFRWLTVLAALVMLAVVLGILYELARHSGRAFGKFGFGFLISQVWNPVTEEFGAASSVFGTLVSTLIAMVMAVPVGIVVALFLVELAPAWLSKIVGTAVELLAAIPSIIYGMWGLFVLAPILGKYVQPALDKYTGGLPLFEGAPIGIGMLPAGIVLSIMILPFVTAVTRDVFLMVPPELKESAFGVGSTTWETTWKVTLRYGLQGVVGAGFLALGRALGETMAVTFVIGNAHRISARLYDPGNTIASALANEFGEVNPEYQVTYFSSLIALAFILFLITFVVQLAAQIWLRRVARSMGAR